MKKLSLITSLLLASTLAANEVDTLRKQVETNKNVMFQGIKSNKKEINLLKRSLEDYDFEDFYVRLDETEKVALQDKIALDLLMKIRVNNNIMEMGNNKKKYINNLWSQRVAIGLKSKIAENMKFTGRLTMQKYWANSLDMYEAYDNMQGRNNFSNSKVWFERAYIDWLMNPTSTTLPVTLTIGRQPSSDGPSSNVKTNTARKSTYSALMFDGASDGVVLTMDTKKYIANSNFRLGFGKGFQENPLYNNLNDNIVMMALYEMSLSKDVAKKSIIQFGYVAIRDLVGDLSQSSTANENVGSMDVVGFMLELQNIKNSPFTFFLHGGFTMVKPNGKTVSLDVTGDGAVDGDFGLLSNGSSTSSKNGYAFWLGGKYEITKKHQVGIEYNQGSKNWISMTQGANNPCNKLSTRGHVVEAYFNYLINRYTSIRLGYIDVTYDYTGSGNHMGAPVKISSLDATSGAYQKKSIKNGYVELNVNY